MFRISRKCLIQVAIFVLGVITLWQIQIGTCSSHSTVFPLAGNPLSAKQQDSPVPVPPPTSPISAFLVKSSLISLEEQEQRLRNLTHFLALPQRFPWLQYHDYISPVKRKDSTPLSLQQSFRQFFALPVCSWTPLRARGYPYAPEWSERSNDTAELLFFLLFICHRHGFVCRLNNGAILGSLRHGGMIPFDDDADLVVLVPSSLGKPGWARFWDEFISVMSQEIEVARTKYALPYVFHGRTKWWWSQVTNQRTFTQNVKIGQKVTTGSFIDLNMVVDINQREKYDLCRCYYGQVQLICMESAHRHMRDTYGNSYMVPYDFHSDPKLYITKKVTNRM